MKNVNVFLVLLCEILSVAYYSFTNYVNYNRTGILAKPDKDLLKFYAAFTLDKGANAYFSDRQRSKRGIETLLALWKTKTVKLNNDRFKMVHLKAIRIRWRKSIVRISFCWRRKTRWLQKSPSAEIPEKLAWKFTRNAKQRITKNLCCY